MRTFLWLCLLTTACFAGKDFTRRWGSLKPSEVNVRVGPGQNYPVDWVYVRAGLPVEIVAEFDVWRKIRDVKGTEGWVHQSMLSAKRHGLIQSPEALLYKNPTLSGCPIARLQKDVVVDLIKCKDEWCQIRIKDYKGWVQRAVLWGTYPQEQLD